MNSIKSRGIISRFGKLKYIFHKEFKPETRDSSNGDEVRSRSQRKKTVVRDSEL